MRHPRQQLFVGRAVRAVTGQRANAKRRFLVRRLMWATLGGALAVAAVLIAYSLAREEFYDFFLVPKAKGDEILPRRWQDLVMIPGVLAVPTRLLWGFYRVLQSVFRRPAGKQ